MSDSDLTARARRKLETLALIHEIAVRQVQSLGLDETRVEDIAAEASISRRTFFNYFATKEDAVLGLQPPVLPEGATERFEQSRDDMLTRTAHLVVEVIRTTIVPSSSPLLRRELRQKFPELTQRFELRAVKAEALVRPVMKQYLSHTTSDDVESDIDVLLSLSTGVVRYAYALKPELDNQAVASALQTFKNTIRKRL